MYTRSPRVLLALLVGAILLAPATPASGVVSADTVAIGSGTTSLTATGHGYGHGHGMSQYGAKGAALAGLTSQQILAFYYPGTTLTSLKAKLRVLITRDNDDNTIVLPTHGLKVTDRGTGKSYLLPTSVSARAWRLRVVDGHQRVAYLTSYWHRYRPGGRTALAGDGEFSSSVGRLTLRTPSGDRVYRGTLRLVNQNTVNVLGLQSYLKGVVPSEMPASWSASALQAQAVAARTYAARARADNASRYYHICDTTACQVYNGVGAEQSTTSAAVDATIGQILSYAGKPAFAQFSSSSGGWTSAGSQPYLVAKADTYDTAAVDPHHDWTKSISVAPLRTTYGAGTLQSVQVTSREGGGDWGGRVVTLVLHGTSGDKSLTGAQFRSLYGLKSTYFTLTP